MIDKSTPSQKYYIKNRKRILIAKKDFYKENSSSIKTKVSHFKKFNSRSWIGIIPAYTKCQICGRRIKFNTGDSLKSIHFDHRNRGREPIKSNPSLWLNNHRCDINNLKIWKLCKFGMLCHSCNASIPTQKRIQWLERALIYAKNK